MISLDKKKILKYVVIILVIILILFLGNIIRKTYIISRYKEQSQEYSQITNFYKKYKENNYSTVEIWRKDNVILYKRTSDDGIRMIYNNLDENIRWIINDTKIEDTVNKTALKIEEKEELDNLFADDLLDNEIDANNIWEYINLAFKCSITSKDYSGIGCYEINYQDKLLQYINKENYLCVRTLSGDNDTGLIEYRLNDITEEEVALPDMSNFEINK